MCVCWCLFWTSVTCHSWMLFKRLNFSFLNSQSFIHVFKKRPLKENRMERFLPPLVCDASTQITQTEKQYFTNYIIDCIEYILYRLYII